MPPPIIRRHPNKIPCRPVQIVILCINCRQLPPGIGPQGEVGDIIVGHGIAAGDDRAAFAVGGQALHGAHAGGFEEKLWLKTSGVKEVVDDGAHGGGLFYQGK